MTMLHRRTIVCLVALLSLAALAGCGSGAGGERSSPDELAVADLVNSVEGVRDARKAAKFFAAGATPAADKLKKLGGCSLSPVGRAAVSGDTATLRVKLIENRTGNDAGEVEWTFVKEDGAWKIKAAPLP
jgi:hypothetical protein